MKILILANNDMGLYKFRKELLERFIAEGYRVYVSIPEGILIPDIKKIGCKIIKTPISRHGTNPLKDLKLFFTYNKIIKKIKPDIVFTFTIKPNIYGGIASRIEHIPYVVNITGLGTAVEKKSILQILTITLYRFSLKKVQTVFFQNKENEAFFSKKKLALGKHKLIPGSGVNLEFYKPLIYPAGDVIEFVFVARIMKEKGIEQYLEAAKVIKKKYPNTRFHICGFCEECYEEQIEKLQDEGIVVYHGLVKDMRKIYQQVHCVVHPTYYPEGLSNVLLESAACARPIITTDRSGCREVVDNEINGYLVKEKNSEDVIMKLEQFINLSWENKMQMGLEGRKKVELEYDRQIVVEAYMKELNCEKSIKF